jgi:hypothetical protein
MNGGIRINFSVKNIAAFICIHIHFSELELLVSSFCPSLYIYVIYMFNFSVLLIAFEVILHIVHLKDPFGRSDVYLCVYACLINANISLCVIKRCALKAFAWRHGGVAGRILTSHT